MKTRRVDPNLYKREYYLQAASGYQEFRNSQGKVLEPRLREIVSKIPEVKGLKVLDIGCGRGELVFWGARSGVALVTGVDYAKSAIDLAASAKAKLEKEIRKKVSLKKMDAKKLNLANNSFDAVFLIEVLEHLYPEEQESVFKEIDRVLKGDGFVFIHTAPSRWFNDFTYRFWCYPLSTLLVGVYNKLYSKKYGNLAKWKDLRSKYHRLMHVNEPDYFSLKKLFSKFGFVGSIKSTNITVNKPILGWKDQLFNFIVYLSPISDYYPFNIFWGNDFYAVLKKRQ